MTKIEIISNLSTMRCSRHKHNVRVSVQEMLFESGVHSVACHECVDCGRVFIGKTMLNLLEEDYGRYCNKNTSK